MSDKKAWREMSVCLGDEDWSINFLKSGWNHVNGEWFFIEKEAYEAEKQRADRLQEELDDEADLHVKTYNKLRELQQRAERLEKEISEYATISYMMGAENYKDKVKALKDENQKLKEALEKIACYVKPYDLTSEPIKMIETEEAMIAKEALK